MGACESAGNKIENNNKPIYYIKENKKELNEKKTNIDNRMDDTKEKEESIKLEKYIEGSNVYSKSDIKGILSVHQLEIIKKQMEKSVCKIIKEEIKGTGFICLIPYLNIKHLLKVLITCNHVLNDIREGNEIKLIFDEKEKIINIDKNRIIYTNINEDLTIIELKRNEFDDNDYLRIDNNLIYEENELNRRYKDKKIYIIHYPFGKEVKYSDGTLKYIEKYKIEHYCSTFEGSSGAPILNLDNFQVIGIHIGYIKKCNVGKTIKLVIDDFNKNKNNYIIAEIEIREEDINENIRIINSFEQCKREKKWEDDKEDYKYENEKEIKENCEIKINDSIIPFTYFYIFKIKGKFTIQYSFKNLLSKINHMFDDCSSLTNINLSNFNTQNVTNMSYMFYDCYSLTNINLSNFNTQNVTDMSYIFSGCKSLKKENIITKDNKILKIFFKFN